MTSLGSQTSRAPIVHKRITYVLQGFTACCWSILQAQLQEQVSNPPAKTLSISGIDDGAECMESLMPRLVHQKALKTVQHSSGIYFSFSFCVFPVSKRYQVFEYGITINVNLILIRCCQSKWIGSPYLPIDKLYSRQKCLIND